MGQTIGEKDWKTIAQFQSIGQFSFRSCFQLGITWPNIGEKLSY